MNGWPFLLAAQESLHHTFEFGRIRSNNDWILPVFTCVVILVVVHAVYRRDAHKLSRPLSFLLTFLRNVVVFSLLLFYLQPQWRYEREVVRNSQVLVLVDTSSSMALSDTASGNPSDIGTRLDRARSALTQTGFLPSLCRIHDTSIQAFDLEVTNIGPTAKGRSTRERRSITLVGVTTASHRARNEIGADPRRSDAPSGR